MKKILFLALMLAASLVSCKQIDITTETGSLAIAVTDLSDYVVVETKTGGIDYNDYNNYDVVIEGPTKISGKYGELFLGKIVELGSGNYTITVTSPATEPAAFEQPIYRAYEEFVIKAGEVTDLKLTCVPYNCKVTIELSENFKKELATYEVDVTNGLGHLVWTKDASKDDFADGKAGYFLARGLEVKVKGFRSIDNTEANAVYYVKNPQPAEHHIIKLDAKVTGSVGGITIDVVTTFNEVSDDIYIGGIDEDYVNRPDFGDEDQTEEQDMSPTITWDGNAYFDPVMVEESSIVRMVIKAPAGIKSFRVNVSENFKGALGMMTNTEIAELVQKKDPETGEPLYKEKKDGAGNIIYQEKRDENGNIMYDEVSKEVIYETDENGNKIPVMVPDYEVVKILGEDGKPVKLTGVDYIDLIEHAFIWYPLNLPVAEDVKDQTEIVFELTPFIPTLCGAASGMTVQFMLEAYDNNDVKVRWTDMSGKKKDPVVTMGVNVEPQLD